MNAITPIKPGPTHAPVGGTGASIFTMTGAPLLSEGASFDGLAAAENLWLSLKVYSSGGENAFHAHTLEDHAFIVLQGRATFHFPDGTTQDVTKFQGVMLPKGVAYRFEADEAENLVLLRVGAAQRKTQGVPRIDKSSMPDELKGTTFDLDGALKDGRAAKTGTPAKPIVPIPGRYFEA
jgi:mannose-6-phosphate isomerase-like protein (cupin superfamily)